MVEGHRDTMEKLDFNTSNVTNEATTTDQRLQDVISDENEKENCRQAQSSASTVKDADVQRDDAEISSAVHELVNKLHKDPTGIYLKKVMHERGINSDSMKKRTSNDFIFHSILGEGAFSTVYLTTEVNTDKRYAMKVLSTYDVMKKDVALNVMRERDILAALTYAYGGHPFIMRLYCTFREPKRLFFALGYAQHGELLSWLNRLGSFDETVTQFYASEILEGLAFLHSCRIIHRDLKPENILVGEDWHIIISDFGAAKILDLDDGGAGPMKMNPLKSMHNTKRNDERRSFIGTAFYVSPEVVNREKVEQECDYWALGAIIFQMISGQPPFRGISDGQVLRKITSLSYSFPDGFPAAARDLIEKLLVLKPNRLGSLRNGGVEALKRHPFFANVDWKNITKNTPPVLKPYLPASEDEPAFYGSHVFNDQRPLCKDLEPGLSEETIRRLNFAEFESFNGSGGQVSDRTWFVDPAQSAAEEEKIRREENHEKQLARQRENNPYHSLVNKHLIIHSGFMYKKKGLSVRKRMFILTEGPHLYYFDDEKKELKGEVPLTVDVRTEAKNFRTFFVYTPLRTYYLSDEEHNAKKWCDTIDSVIKFYFKSDVKNS